MGATKSISSGDYNVTTTSPNGNVVVTTNTFIVRGNLWVAGNTTQANATITAFVDPIIQLNANVHGSPYPGQSGLEVIRGTSPTVGLLWSEALQSWQLTNDGTTFANISTQTAGGSFITHVQEDLAPNLGGNLNTNNFTITSNIGVVTFDQSVALTYVGVAPAAQNGKLILYATSNEEEGGTGLYYTRVGDTQQEIISKRRAIIYSLIF